MQTIFQPVLILYTKRLAASVSFLSTLRYYVRRYCYIAELLFLFFIFINPNKLLAQKIERNFSSKTRSVTASDYCNFLNAEASDDPFHLYEKKMETSSQKAAIVRRGSPGNYSYQLIAGREETPITFVSEGNEEAYCQWSQELMALPDNDHDERDILNSLKSSSLYLNLVIPTSSLSMISDAVSSGEEEASSVVSDVMEGLIAAIAGMTLGSKSHETEDPLTHLDSERPKGKLEDSIKLRSDKVRSDSHSSEYSGATTQESEYSGTTAQESDITTSKWELNSDTSVENDAKLSEENLLKKEQEQRRLAESHFSKALKEASDEIRDHHRIIAFDFQESAEQYKKAAIYLKQASPENSEVTELLKKASLHSQEAAHFHGEAAEAEEKNEEQEKEAFKKAAKMSQSSADLYAKAAEYLQQNLFESTEVSTFFRNASAHAAEGAINFAQAVWPYLMKQKQESEWFHSLGSTHQSVAEQNIKAAETLIQSSLERNSETAALLRSSSEQAQIAANYYCEAAELQQSNNLKGLSFVNQKALYAQTSADCYSKAAKYSKIIAENNIEQVRTLFTEALTKIQQAAELFAQAASCEVVSKNLEEARQLSETASAAQSEANALELRAVRLWKANDPHAEIPFTTSLIKKSAQLKKRFSLKSKSAGSLKQDEATTFLSLAKEITKSATDSEQRAEEAFTDWEESNNWHALYPTWLACQEAYKMAYQATEAWIKTAEMHQDTPGRKWGIRLKNKWADNANKWQQRSNEMLQEIYSQASQLSTKGQETIANIKQRCDMLNNKKAYDTAYQLSAAYEKIIDTENALTFFLQNTEEKNRNNLLLLNIAMESVEITTQDALLLDQQIINPDKTTSDSYQKLASDKPSSLQEIENFFSMLTIKTDAINRAFQKNAESALIFGTQILEAVEPAFDFFTMGGELSDQADVEDLSLAYDQLKSAIALLRVVKENTKSADLFFKEKQDLAIKNLQEAAEHARIIATRLEEYEQDHNRDRILNNLSEIQKTYQDSLRTK